ncbi:MAG: hypothetical protein HQM10_26650 [Candidatus Riflebacteria bacterium]|nr:hypothetical protein [Candidatus Riflebacteria bacterium]
MINMKFRIQDHPELYALAKEWGEKANKYGDKGSCVRGAGFSFKWKGKTAFLSPICHTQGSLSWEHCKEEIESKLKELGATDIDYKWGMMD